MKHDPNKLARVLKVLAVGTRVRIVQLLREETLCVNGLAARLHVTQGAVSQHLRVMRDADLVINERRGYRVHYRLNEKTLAQWQAAIGALLAPLDREQPENVRKQGERPCAAMKKSMDAGNLRT